MESLVASAMPLLDRLFSAFGHLEAWGAGTNFMQIAALDAKLEPLGASLGMQLSLLKYTIALFLAYPMAAILRALPHKNLKHLFSLIGGVCMVQWIFGPEWIHSLLSSVGTYLICLVVPVRYQPTLVFVWAMTYMTRIFDATGTQMVLTMKLTSFPYNLYDGTVDKDRVNETYEDKRLARLYGDRKKFAISALPNPLEFFGYIYCFTCILAGPAFEYKDYVDAIDGSAFQPPAVKENSGSKAGSKISREPSSLLPGLRRLLLSVVFLVGHMTLAAKYPFSRIYDKVWVAENTWYFRFAYSLATLFAERLKYYFVWKVAEGASVLGGFGFEGFDPKDPSKVIGWSAVENIDVVGFETGSSVQPLSRSWNKRTQGWLERYTYGRWNNSLVITYFVSALWHGLYPGFFIFFMTVPVLTNIERLVRAKINPMFIPGYNGRDYQSAPNTIMTKLYWVVCIVLTKLSTNFCVQVFSLYSWERCMLVLGSYNFIPHILFFVIYGILSIMPAPKHRHHHTRDHHSNSQAAKKSE